MASTQSVDLSFEFANDNFPHGWFFNRFRKERVGNNTMLTFVLATDAGVVASNAVVIADIDLNNSRSQTLDFLKRAGEQPEQASAQISFSPSPARVYPINHIQLSRVDQLGEIGFYRFSIATAAAQIADLKTAKSKKSKSIQCYPVVMFRCDFSTQLELVKELNIDGVK